MMGKQQDKADREEVHIEELLRFFLGEDYEKEDKDDRPEGDC